MLLDEVDKMSSDLRGDPAHSRKCSTLSKPASKTNLGSTSTSHIVFVCTANSLQGIPPAARPADPRSQRLRRRKVEIARRISSRNNESSTG